MGVIMSCDTGHMTCDTWQVTHVMWHTGGGEHCVKISDPYLLRFGSNDVLKILSKRSSQQMNELMTKLFVEQPWLHLNYVCDFMPHKIVYVG